ncbi:MAG: type II secretion system minor pseudopilin GspK [Gammaproteobacteria bacterium]
MRETLPRRSKGVALITALLVVALATIAAAAMASRQQLDLRRTGNILDGDQAYLYTLGAEAWAVGILVKDRKENQTDSLGDDWATVLPAIPVEGGQITGVLEDLQGRFNINNLLTDDNQPSPPDIEIFQRLLAALDLEPRLALAVVDWLDPDIDPQPLDGAEDDQYLGEQPPYRTANQRMASATELRLIRGFPPEAYERLAPYIVALPFRTPINVNTASIPVLMALGNDITASDAEALIQARGEKGFADVNAFLQQPVLSGGKINPQAMQSIAVESHYFLLKVEAHIGQGRAQLSSLIERAQNGKIRIVMRSREIM